MFANKERERETLVQAHQSKHSIGGSTIRERERERERDVCVRQFFFTLGTRLRIYLCKESDRTRCLAVSILEYNINSNSKWAERAKAFWFSEGRTK